MAEALVLEIRRIQAYVISILPINSNRILVKATAPGMVYSMIQASNFRKKYIHMKKDQKQKT